MKSIDDALKIMLDAKLMKAGDKEVTVSATGATAAEKSAYARLVNAGEKSPDGKPSGGNPNAYGVDLMMKENAGPNALDGIKIKAIHLYKEVDDDGEILRYMILALERDSWSWMLVLSFCCCIDGEVALTGFSCFHMSEFFFFFFLPFLQDGCSIVTQ